MSVALYGSIACFPVAICLCVSVSHQYCPGEGDPADVSDRQHLHRRVGAAAAPPAAVDPQTRPVRPLPLHRPHLHRREPDVRPHGSAPQGAGERASQCVWVTAC